MSNSTISRMKFSPAQGRRRSSRKAFTLMEMLLVLGIIALLIGMGTYMMVGVLGDAEEGKVKADIQSLKASLIRYKTKVGIYPTTGQGLKALAKRPSDGPKGNGSWKALIKEQALYDPWGSEYQYRYPATKGEDDWDIWSLGKDQSDNTGDEIGNW